MLCLFNCKRKKEKDDGGPNDGCEILFEGEGPIAADIIFVHGLRGHRRKTWTKGDICWPKDLLSKEETLLHTRVLTFGYDANVVNFLSATSRNSLFVQSINLLNALARERRRVPVNPV
jgi:hypothetical protein